MADTIEVIKAVGAIITPIVLAYIAYKQIGLSKKQDAIRKDVDGKMTQLLEVTGAKERSEGKAEGKQEQRAETKEDTAQPVQTDPPVTSKDAEIIATTVVETVKKDPDIEIKKTE